MMRINKLKVAICYLHEYTYCSTKVVDTLIRLKIVDPGISKFIGLAERILFTFSKLNMLEN